MKKVLLITALPFFGFSIAFSSYSLVLQVSLFSIGLGLTLLGLLGIDF